MFGQAARLGGLLAKPTAALKAAAAAAASKSATSSDSAASTGGGTAQMRALRDLARSGISCR